MLAVVIEAMTINSADEVKNLNRPFNNLKLDDFDTKISLSKAIFMQNSEAMLQRLLIEDANKTFKYISNRDFIQKIYAQVGYTPLWFNQDGLKKRLVKELFEVIEKDPMLDKRGNIYKRLKYLKKSVDKNLTMEEMLKKDIMITSLYKSYLNFHIFGSIKWWSFQNYLKRLRANKISASWITYNPKFDIADLILTYKPKEVIEITTPKTFGYRKMLKELKRLKEVKAKGGFTKVPNSSQLKYGKSGKIVAKLKRRLIESGDYRCSYNEGNKYGACLRKAVKRFQKRHGLYPSGKINRQTIKKLNISVDWKINKLLLNLDRIKRLPRTMESRYIMVNIPSFRLYYFKNFKEELSMRVIVGDKKHHTPIFSNRVSFIVLNPYWIIPDSIVKKEIIPKILKNPQYLKERGYEVRLSYNLNTPPIDTSKIDWAKVLKYNQTKKYKFVQPPGPKNALGKIKFKFPNQFSVYLHDTSDKKLFKKAIRAFSHGCIRVSEPDKLLYTFTKYEDSISYNKCQAILKSKNKAQINLENSIPIHIIYLTAWVDSKGLLYYFNDIYNYDKHQKRAIQ
jgi:murein L,D-transpeptidase YcbB/YkuD